MRTANATGVSWKIVECPDCGHMRDPDWKDCYYCGISDEQKQDLFEDWYCPEKGPALEPVPTRADNQPLAPRRQPADERELLLDEMAEAN